MIPVGDLLGESVLHRRPGLLDPLQPPPPHLLQVLRNHVSDRVRLRSALQVAGDPGALGAGQNLLRQWFVRSERPVVQVRGVACVARFTVGIQLHVQQTP
ncbi:hypothetical protein HRbin30_01844 [bacterium HR30]|nr:hypothetical protein HRbin30_01844 [bacterium HR30]